MSATPSITHHHRASDFQQCAALTPPVGFRSRCGSPFLLVSGRRPPSKHAQRPKARRLARRVEIHGESWIDGEGWLLSRGSGEGRASVWVPLTWAMDVENVGAWCR